jgi:hypothetical protein
MTKEHVDWSYNPASLILVGEMTETLRAQGNVSATGTRINATTDSPVRDGVYSEIPQAQVGFMQYSEFANSAKKFNEIPSTETAYSGRHPWNLIGATSLDAVFYPYTTQTDEYRAGKWLPYWTRPTTSDGGQPTATELNPFNPFNTLSGISPTGGYSASDDPWMSSGHNIAMALNYNPKDSGVDGSGGFVGDTGIYPSGSGSPIDFYFEKDHWARHTVETQGVRGVGFKAPMVLTGWGYDTGGNPVPSSGDTFHPQAMHNPHLWKSGPVDLRWDDDRGVWTGGNTTKIYLVKLTNLYTPPSFSFEVDRSNSRDQYSRNGPQNMRAFDSTEAIYDPEYVAYTANEDNKNYYEQLDYTSLEFPFYEAFIIRETTDQVGQDYYNIWTNDCQDCGHITNSGCGTQHGSDSTGKRVLIENPLRQSFDAGDLAFTVDTGRKKNVNTGSFVGGSGVDASGQIVIDASGSGSFEITSSGSGYAYGGLALYLDCDICTSLSLVFTDGKLTSGTLDPNTGLTNYNSTCDVQIYPNNATAETESLPIHWVTQAEFKSQQVVTHVECDNGTLQSCTLKLQTQGYKTCEWCGEDTALINN